MGKIDILRNGSITFRNGFVTLRIVQLADAAGECILLRRGSDALFPNYFGEDLFYVSYTMYSRSTASRRETDYCYKANKGNMARQNMFLFMSISQEIHVQTSPNFLYVAVATVPSPTTALQYFVYFRFCG